MVYKNIFQRREGKVEHYDVSVTDDKSEWVNVVLRRFLHNHANSETEGNSRSGLCPTLIE